MSFRWEDIDDRLVVLKLMNLAEEMRHQIRADKWRIQSESHGDLNRKFLVLKMEQDRADEWARRAYEIYCEVWQTQGHAKSADFVRAVGARVVMRLLRARTERVAHEFTRFARGCFPFALRDAKLNGFRLNMLRLESRWRRRLEIEAKECEHAERIAKSRVATLTNGQTSQKESLSRVLAGLNQPPAAGSGQSVPALALRNRTRPGPRSKRSESFVFCAGTLWRTAISKSGSRVPVAELSEIASKLDAANHLPPADYLEGKYAREVKDFNRRHSNSTKIGPLRTWSQLVSNADKDHLQGMRRLLSRCANAPEMSSGIRK
jgi:hypothetical protein